MRWGDASARGVLAALLAAPALLGPAGSRAAEDDARLWAVAAAQVPVTERLTASLEVQGRFADDVSELERVVVRPSLVGSLTEWAHVALGYDAHIVESPRDRLEQRVWQQLSVRHRKGDLSGGFRFRLEERIFEGLDGAALRARMRLRLSHPLPGSGWYAAASNEVLVGLNSLRDGPERGFDENRLFVGIGRDLPRGLRLEGGYRLQYVDRPGRDLASHILVVAVIFARD